MVSTEQSLKHLIHKFALFSGLHVFDAECSVAGHSQKNQGKEKVLLQTVQGFTDKAKILNRND